MIRLSNDELGVFYLNRAHIAGVLPNGAGSTIVMSFGLLYAVTESVDDVMLLISHAGA